MKKIISVLMCLVLLVNVLPMTVALADNDYVVVTKDSAPIRNDYYETGDVMKWVPYGTVLQVVGTKTNSHFNLWLKVRFDDPDRHMCREGWIYSGNVQEHRHNYIRYNYNGNTFCVCEDCHTISIEQVRTVPLSRMDSISLAVPTAIGTAMADSPAIGPADVAAVFILIMAAFEIGTEPQMTEVIEMVDTMDITKFTEGTNKCGIDSYYKVELLPTGLKKMDDKCMNIFQAFICARMNVANVWTETMAAAEACAALNGRGRYFGPERDKEQPAYFYHYHLGRNADHKDSPRHIFFGTNDYGQRPQ